MTDSTTTSAAQRDITVEFTGTVTKVEMLGQRALTVTPVHFDPRYAVFVTIQTVAPDSSPLVAGTERIFAIHSPSRLFFGKPVIGKSYRFTVTWDPDRTRFSGLRLVMGK